MKKKIKINFVDFWENFDYKKSLIYEVLCKKYDVVVTQDCNYLFYSCFGNSYINYDCVRIFVTGENQIPDFNMCDYAIGFDYIDYEDRYLRYPIYLSHEFINDYKKMLNKKKFTLKDLSKKTFFCTFVVSNEINSNKIRVNFYKELSKYKKVLSGGKVLNNVGYQVENKLEFLEKSKFNIAFENTSHNGYTTEKIVQAFASNTVPIYWGDPKINLVFNKKAFINISDFKDIDDAIEYIKKVDNDDKLYLEIINEKPLLKIENEQIKLENFLFNIFNQDYDKSFRRIFDYRGNYLTKEKKEFYKYYNSLFYKIKRKIKRWLNLV